MGEKAHISVAETSDGPGGTNSVGDTVSLPVVELLTGRGFVTGKSGSGKSNSASVIVEKLLDNGFGLLIVDVDGEYYGLKEEYEILHVGADEECDIQVTTEHAEKISSLALEQNVPIILDVSSYLDESEAEELLTAVSRNLFAKAKKQKQPFLLLVEEVHEYIPEQGSVGECGRMLIKIGKRGRKHGLGICGISQRPADVKKDFITQCDWLLWHRLTWKNDTQVVRRILDGEYAEAVENMHDGEGFLVTDWSENVRRVQFYRKETFDAGATPGLEDFERPDLKSVSEDLVSELESISDEAAAHESRISELRAQLDEKNSRIAELERELRDARDLQDLAEQFVAALTARGEAAGLTEREKMRDNRPVPTPETDWPGGWREDEEESVSDGGIDEQIATDGEATVSVANSDESGDVTDDTAHGGTVVTDEERDEATGEKRDEATGEKRDEVTGENRDEATDDDVAAMVETITGVAAGQTASQDEQETDPAEFNADEILSRLRNAPDRPFDSVFGSSRKTDARAERADENEQQVSSEYAGLTVSDMADNSEAEQSEQQRADERGQSEQQRADERGQSVTDSGEREQSVADTETEANSAGTESVRMPDAPPAVVEELKSAIEGMETKTQRMLSFYREHGPASAQNAHFAAGGNGDRTLAYARNRTLRTRGLVEHVGRGRYDYCLPSHLESELEHADEAVVEVYTSEIEALLD